jgi:hypothetical protein
VFVVELTATLSGDYVVSYSGDLPSLPPRVVFDDGHRYPNHPKPGMRKPLVAVNDGRPTDPAVLAEVQALVTEFVEQHPTARRATAVRPWLQRSGDPRGRGTAWRANGAPRITNSNGWSTSVMPPSSARWQPFPTRR